jgi:hypothetical protein
MTLQHHRPDGKGGLEPRPVADPNWRRQLRSSRWGASLRGGVLPGLKNPEVQPARTGVAIAFWIALAGLTFVLLVAGYGSGFWR